MPRTAWIVGAGFSKPLGGPLLPDLLSPETPENLVAVYGTEGPHPLNTPATQTAHWLYNYGTRFKYGRLLGWAGDGMSLWRDAEEYLDYLDLAASSFTGKAANRLRPLIANYLGERGQQPLPIGQIAGGARRLVAAECSAFLEGADLDSERWSPYVRWARELVGPDDAILTFNYDEVVEMLATKIPDRFKVVTPGEAPEPRRASVYKLHGSVNWMWDSNGVRPSGTTNFAVQCADAALLGIASPGPTKQSLTRHLESLWRLAIEALRNAECVVFVGYRFPQTDANAKKRLIDALGDLQQMYVAIHIVLGPDTNTPDARRMEQMVRYALRRRPEHPPGREQPANYEQRFNLVVQPLWAEDFFSVVNGGILHQPWMKSLPSKPPF